MGVGIFAPDRRHNFLDGDKKFDIDKESVLKPTKLFGIAHVDDDV